VKTTGSKKRMQRSRSTTEIGNELRDQVIDLLEAEGHRVTRETRFDTKKIDILLEIDEEFRPQKIAIECKNVGNNVSQKILNEIYAYHINLLEKNFITGIFVISRLDFSPDAKYYAEQTRGLNIFTIVEFEESLLGYRNYCRDVRELFNDAGLAEYYIQSSIEGGGKLHSNIMKWIDNDNKAPTAILGGYGMGKTSYCKYLTRTLADRYLEGTSARIPIYVRLSDIATQTDIDGLIAKTLAGRYRTKNYSFGKFKRLNRSGKFVIIFDGFDEMKHALSWTDFKYNFSQINSLLEGNAKIIVAGRPNAFLSDDEHSWILRGERRFGEQIKRAPGEPKYIEHQISPFSENDVTEFLEKFLRYFLPSGTLDKAGADQWIAERVADFKKIKSNDDLYRPVHLKIYAEIAADPSLKLESYTTYELYMIATSRISDREGEKIVRKQLDATKRQRIIENIAWWLWDTYSGRRLYFVPSDLPDSIIEEIINKEQVYDKIGIYREILTGSFLDRKYGENYYFSHRSYLEFFVARRLELIAEKEISVQSIFRNMNQDILNFIKQSPGYDKCIGEIYAKMQIYRCEIPVIFVKEIQSYHSRKGREKAGTAVQVLLRYAPYILENIIDEDKLESLLEKDLSASNQEYLETSIYFILNTLVSTGSFGGPLVTFLACLAEKVRWDSDAITQFNSMDSKGSKDSKDSKDSKGNYERANYIEYIFMSFVEISPNTGTSDDFDLIFDIHSAFKEMHYRNPPRLVIAEVMQNKPARRLLRLKFGDVFRNVSAADRVVAGVALRTRSY